MVVRLDPKQLAIDPKPEKDKNQYCSFTRSSYLHKNLVHSNSLCPNESVNRELKLYIREHYHKNLSLHRTDKLPKNGPILVTNHH